jgi:hypothetical protein
MGVHFQMNARPGCGGRDRNSRGVRRTRNIERILAQAQAFWYLAAAVPVEIVHVSAPLRSTSARARLRRGRESALDGLPAPALIQLPVEKLCKARL